ncbi:hypothetical protein [Parasitella parasitica]|uniref:Uncharacterized protein n=1 Tax=Parasitella parasitica TaxID=35722 RepID=A0A0B7NLT8_9FUNG|nr:hypothetical protein [Parasitella parasitica]
MTRDTSGSLPEDNKKDSANFFSKWFSTNNRGDGWDEVCLQWCKQKAAARKENVDPNCSMLCFNRPTNEAAMDEDVKWNPLKRYTVSVISGKKECTMHTNEMKEPKDTEKQKTNNLETTYELDLGDIWTQADIKGPFITHLFQQIINEKMVPLYNSSIEQAMAFKDSSEAVRFQEYVKSKSNDLFNQIYSMSPLKFDKKSNVNPSVNPDEKR